MRTAPRRAAGGMRVRPGTDIRMRFPVADRRCSALPIPPPCGCPSRDADRGMSDAAGLLAKLKEAYKKKDWQGGKSLMGQIKVGTGTRALRGARRGHMGTACF